MKEGIQTIDEAAFQDCNMLSSVTFPKTLTTIGRYAFENCLSLKKAEFFDGLESIDGHAFRNCLRLESVTIPGTVHTISEYAFKDAGIKKLTLCSGVSYIQNYAFSGCKNLSDVVIPGSVSTIGLWAFEECRNLKVLTLENGISQIGAYAFTAGALENITIPGSVISIDKGAFYNNASLKKVIIQDGVKQLNTRAFGACENLESIVIPESVSSFGDYIFGYSIPRALKIYGSKGTSAENYAKTNNIPFIADGESQLGTPSISKISATVSGAHVYWNKISNATSYTVYRAASKNGVYTKIMTTTATNYTDTNVKSGNTYFYKISANAGEDKSDDSAAKGMAFVGTPDITLRVNRSTGVGLGWNGINGATGYAVYRKSYSGNDPWVRVATVTNPATLSWTDTSVKSKNGSVYRYTVRALAGSDRKTLSGCRNTGRTMVRLMTPVLNSVSATSATALKVTWGKNSQATGYEVRLMTGGKVYKTYTVAGSANLTKTISGLKKGTTYKIQVRAYKSVSGVGSFYSAWSGEKNVTLK